jgi:small-conductance mechanosensitive channel
MSSNSAASSASINPDTDSATSAEPVVFYVDDGPCDGDVRTYRVEKGVRFHGYNGDRPVIVTYESPPIERSEDNSRYNTSILRYKVRVRIDDPTNPSASFTADGTLHCRTYIFCEDESIEEGTPNYSAWIELCHPITKKPIEIDYPRNIR